MSPSWISTHHTTPLKQDDPTTKTNPTWLSRQTKRFWIIICTLLLLITIALAIGLGVGLTRSHHDNGGTATTTPSTPLNNTNTTAGTYWQPTPSTPWQIVLESTLNTSTLTTTSPNVPIYDIDLFTNPASTIDALHALNRSVICYFSAGSYETFRPDSSQFLKSDYAKPLKGWKGEYWLNTNSSNVRNIMKARLELAAQKGCDGVDPDNVDGYDNDSGMELTEDTAVEYLAFLAVEAHSLGLAIGLKNAGGVVNRTVGWLQWVVNEQCGEFGECGDWRGYVEVGKPVFRIEYPGSAPSVSESTKEGICGESDTGGFSTVIKKMELDEWVEYC